MAKKYLVVIDMQNDFVTDALGTAEAQAVRENVVRRVGDFAGEVLFTRDTHGADYLQTQEGRKLPVEHCIRGTAGWELIAELEKFRKREGCHVFEKNTFGSLELAQYLLEKYEAGEVESVELIGLCTDICVVSNALLLKAYMPELEIAVDASCCAGVTPDKHEAALETMESCQIDVINR